MSKRVVLFFVLTLIICLLAPLTCDDWGNSVIYSNLNIIDYFKESIDMYFTWEGRFVSRILICILTPLKLLWSIITPFMLTLIYYIGLKLLGEKGKEVSKNLLFIALLLININMFSQSYIWIAGSITYLYPTALSFLYFYYLYKKNGESFSILETIILVLGCITIPMFVENIGCSFVLGNIIFLIYDTYKNKRIDKKLLIFSIISIVSIFVMLISPGSKLRTNVNTEFYQMDVFSKICSNIPNLIFTMFTSNIILILITIIPIIYTLFKSDKIKKIRILSIPLFLIIPFLTIIGRIGKVISVNINIDFTNLIFLPYWVIYVFLFLFSIIFIIKDKEKRLFLIFLFLISFSSILCMLIVHVWGARIAVFLVLSLIIISIVLINNIIGEHNIIKYLSRFLLVITIIGYIAIMLCVHVFDNKREKHIYEQIKNGNNQIEVYYNPIRLVWNNNLSDEWFISTYKKYLNVDEDYDFKIKKIGIREYINIIIKK